MKPRLSRHFSRASVSAAGIFITATQVHAADRFWDSGGGGGDTDFNTAVNWNDDTLPGAGDNALINGMVTVTSAVGSSGSRLGVLELGRWGGTGTLTQTAGTVYTQGFNVGFVGTGEYNLNGSGSIDMINSFILGHSGGGATESGNGTFNMNTTGNFNTNYVHIGDSSWGSNKSSGTFNMIAGTVTSTNGFRVGGGATATAGYSGAMNMSGGTVNSNGSFAIGDGWTGAKGDFVMTGGTLNVSSEFFVGNGHAGDYSTRGHGTATLSSGVLNVGSWFGVGRDGSEGTLTISGDAVVNQGITDSGSRLELGNFGADNNSTLNLNGGTLAVNGIVDAGGGGNSTTFNWNGGTLKARQDNSDFLNADTINVQNGGAVIDTNGFNIGIDNALVANGTGGLTKSGNGTLTLSGANTYSGGTSLNGGTLALGSSGALGTTGIISFGGGTLQHSASNTTDYSSRFSTAASQAYKVDTNGQNVTWATDLTSSGGSMAKSGNGTLTLSGANTYSGGTTVYAGRIEANNNTALGSGAVSIAAGAAVLVNANSLTIANDFTLNGTTSGGALVSGNLNGGNVTTLSGTITLAADSNIASWWNDKQLTLSGKITGSGNLTFDRATALGGPVGGNFFVSGATNDYTGSTTVNGRSDGALFGFSGNAILQLGAANALPTGTTLTLNYANLSLNGFNQTLGGLVASTSGSTVDSNGILSYGGVGADGTVMASQIVNGNATAVTLTVNNATANTFAGVLGGAGTDENNFAVTKGGAGTLTLSGANTFTGATTINAGTLAINGNQNTATGSVSVNNAGTRLIGTGTVGGNTTVNSGAIHSAGGAVANVDKVGLQTFDESGAATTNLSYGAGSIFEWDLNTIGDTDGYDHDSNGGTGNINVATRGAGYDAVDVTGTLAVDSGAIFRVLLGSSVTADDFWQQTQTWTDIFGGGFVLDGGFANNLLQVVDTSGNPFDQSALNPGYGFTVSGTTLTWSAVPEPSSALAGLLVATGLLRRRRA